jgi:hypothetical protein
MFFRSNVSEVAATCLAHMSVYGMHCVAHTWLKSACIATFENIGKLQTDVHRSSVEADTVMLPVTVMRGMLSRPWLLRHCCCNAATVGLTCVVMGCGVDSPINRG